MKRLFLTITAILTLFLSGCQINNGTDISAYSNDMAKAQEITVIAAGTSEILETITSRDDIEHFILSLESDKWKWKTPPENAAEVGSFHLTQEKRLSMDRQILMEYFPISPLLLYTMILV